MFVYRLKHYSVMYLVIIIIQFKKFTESLTALASLGQNTGMASEEEVLTHSTGIPDQSFLVGLSEGC